MAKATKLLERMKLTKNGWGHDDLEIVYIGHGFAKREGSHSFYYHPEYPDLCGTVARHTKLAKGYVVHAVKTIDEYKRRKQYNSKK